MNIPLFKIHWSRDDIQAVTDVIKSGQYWCTGPQIELFENAICDYLGVPFCTTFNSGGTSLEVLMKAYNFKQGDEIIVPSFTFIATAYAPLYVGAKPIFCDIDGDTFGLDPESVKEKLSPKTKAIIPIHYGGLPCQIQELADIAEDHDIILIEDAAESFGSTYHGTKTGCFGDSSIFSFCHNKVFTTSEGGCVVTHNHEIQRRLKLLNSYGRKVDGNYFSVSKGIDYLMLGNNYRMSSIQAALGISQLEKIEEIISLRREKSSYLHNELRKISGISPLIEPSNDYYHIYQMYTIRVKDRRDELLDYLQGKGIGSKIYFDPVHKYSIFSDLGYQSINLPITEEISSEVLTLPMYPNISINELGYIVKTIKSFMENE